MKKQYVLGFAFSQDRKSLILIRKLRPAWQEGKLNGVGGKVEENETPDYAMTREFKEETGVQTSTKDWTYFGNITFKQDIMSGEALIHLYKMFSNDIYKCRTVEKEEISMFNLESLLCNKKDEMMHNLPSLINIALGEFDTVQLTKF